MTDRSFSFWKKYSK